MWSGGLNCTIYLSMTKQNEKVTEKSKSASKKDSEQAQMNTAEKEIGGYKDSNLPEPTRYGDWEVNGRCSDF